MGIISELRANPIISIYNHKKHEGNIHIQESSLRKIHVLFACKDKEIQQKKIAIQEEEEEEEDEEINLKSLLPAINR